MITVCVHEMYCHISKLTPIVPCAIVFWSISYGLINSIVHKICLYEKINTPDYEYYYFRKNTFFVRMVYLLQAYFFSRGIQNHNNNTVRQHSVNNTTQLLYRPRTQAYIGIVESHEAHPTSIVYLLTNKAVYVFIRTYCKHDVYVYIGKF